MLVEGMGRINFGRAIKDFKGLVDDVTLTAEVDGDELTWNLKDWRMRRIADDYQTVRRAITTPRNDVALSDNTPSKIGSHHFPTEQDGRHLPQYGDMGQGAGVCQRSCAWQILEHRSAADALLPRMLAQEGRERDCSARRCRSEATCSLGTDQARTRQASAREVG